MREVLTSLVGRWRHEECLVLWAVLRMIVATAADLLMPVDSGRLVGAGAVHAESRSLALHPAVRAIAMMALPDSRLEPYDHAK